MSGAPPSAIYLGAYEYNDQHQWVRQKTKRSEENQWQTPEVEVCRCYVKQVPVPGVSLHTSEACRCYMKQVPAIGVSGFQSKTCIPMIDTINNSECTTGSVPLCTLICAISTVVYVYIVTTTFLPFLI